jgi:hypothetical protein
LKKKKRNNIILGIVGVVIIGLVVSFYYNTEQTRIKGFTFGNDLQSIQEDLKKIQTDFQSEFLMWDDKEISNDEFLEYSKKHISKMEELVLRYDTLDPPEAFTTSVEFFKLSTQSQLEGDKEIILFVQTGDIGSKIRSDSLIKEAFEYELEALAKFNAAKAGIQP